MTSYSEERKKLVQWVKQQLSGEALTFDNGIGHEVLIEPNPFNRYTIGILYPPEDLMSEAGIEETIVAPSAEDSESSFTSSYKYQPPSSMGFSFYADSELKAIRISYQAVRFEKVNTAETEIDNHRRRQWKKIYLAEAGLSDDSGVGVAVNESSTHYVYDGRARIDVTVRSYGDGKIVTVTLANSSRLSEDDNSHGGQDALTHIKNRVENALFEVALSCHFDKSALRNYPRVSKELLTEEEKELELRYKDQMVYAIGHGVAVDWKEVQNDEIMLFSDFMPSYEVPQVTADTADSSSRVLEFEFLQNLQHDDSVLSELNLFVEDYLKWIKTQEQLKQSENADEQVTAQNLINRMHTAHQRMQQGIVALQTDENIQKAFTLANLAMLKQMQRSDPNRLIYKWRPFQLAFFLMVLESTINEENDYRDLVDLIWFPTGGGKTEAYLGVMAFLFIYRRLSYPSSGGGTIAIMRYTLRLLTSQQFVRACKVIGALELIRQQDITLGSDPFSVGLWLGGDSSPNTFNKAKEFKEKQNFSKLVLTACPWCDTAFNNDNYIAEEDRFYFVCHNHDCEFGCQNHQPLPFNVVDEALYQKPPSLLIATVDKFARLAWEERANVFFGGQENLPPELIIQDELHLISGALGSVVGLYETGLETIITSRGVFPKFIASTATIRQASEQVQALFGREMAVFPPVGLRQKDAYFAKEVPITEKPGRLYVGYLAFNRQRKNCLVDLSGALLAAPQLLYPEQDKLKDAWWTQMVYHCSLKGVGNSQTNFQSHVVNTQKRLVMAYFIQEAQRYISNYAELLENYFQNQQGNEARFIRGACSYQEPLLENQNIRNLYQQCFAIREINTKSLTGNNTAEANAAVFNALKLPFNQDRAIDVVLATNMVSVGLDEPRLALMVMNGQPLTTAEYIQASSRVGRGDIPGIVFANYYKNQARSLSHYENFRAYHSAFYRFVEPSSLTPFTEQVRNRALHAALVTAVRHGEKGLLKNAAAEDFMKEANNESTKSIIGKLKNRIDNAAQCAEATHKHLDKLINQWQIEASSALNLRYKPYDRSAKSLLVPFYDDFCSGVWLTLNSMRNVEKTALFEIDLSQQRFVYTNKWLTQVRFSHLTGYSGIGSVVYDNLGWLVKVKDTRTWLNQRELVELHAVERVKSYFQTDKRLLLPHEAKVKSDYPVEVKGTTLPVERFPSWMSCSHCGLLYHKPWESPLNQTNQIDSQLFCSANGCQQPRQPLKQIIWCAVSQNGDLRDVPWHYICHRNATIHCANDSNDSYLHIRDVRGRKSIQCSRCQSRNYFEYSEFNSRSGDRYIVTEVNDARIYTPHTERALVIPPESNIDRSSIAYQLQINSHLISSIEGATRPLEKRREIQKARRTLNCSEAELFAAIDTVKNLQAEEEDINFIATDMISEEYDALTTVAHFPSGADFVTRHLTQAWRQYIANIAITEDTLLAAKLIDQLVAVDRLRVIEVFKGFSRDIGDDTADVSTEVGDVNDYDNQSNVIPPDITGEADWLPALELFGEGIFFTLNSDILKQWESNPYIRLRADEIYQRFQESGLELIDDTIPSARFILLHTLAHLLMRELESFAGYPAASLKERVYCSSADDTMAGVMIFTAVPDIAGTLGGIVQLANPASFLRLLDNALRQAQWCSLDPVCGEMEKQGPFWLNRAACHACVLVPDTCCSYHNVFLDRVLIKGNPKMNIPALIDVVRKENG